MTLIEKLKEYNGNFTVDNLPDELQAEVMEWAENFAIESFVCDDEMEQLENETLRSRVSDIIATMENE